MEVGGLGLSVGGTAAARMCQRLSLGRKIGGGCVGGGVGDVGGVGESNLLRTGN